MPQCRRELHDVGFVEENKKLYCESCFEAHLAPTCARCSKRVKGVRETRRRVSLGIFDDVGLSAGLPERHWEAVPSGMLCLHLLRTPLWQQPLLPGGRTAVLRSRWDSEQNESGDLELIKVGFRLERAVYDEMLRLRLPHRGRRPLG